MRSFIIIEVEHETPGALDLILDHLVDRYGEEVITDYSVAVNRPEHITAQNVPNLFPQ